MTSFLGVRDWGNIVLDEARRAIQGDYDVNARGVNGDSPLHWAARFNPNPAIITALLEAGADVNTQDNRGFTPLHQAAYNNQSPPIITLLLKAGADVNVKGKGGTTPLHQAANNYNQAVITLLLKAGADVNVKNERGRTPLHRSVGEQNLANITLLLEDDADVNAQDMDGNTPLHRAAKISENQAIITALLEANANVNAKDVGGNTPLHQAAYNNQKPAIITLFLKAGADVNVKNGRGRTPLHQSVGKQKNVTLLLEADADVNAKDVDGNTPLHRATEISRDPATITALLEAGVAVNEKDANGNAPLHLALYNNPNPTVLTTLLEADADVNAKNRDGGTPLDHALQGNNQPAINALCTAGGWCCNTECEVSTTALPRVSTPEWLQRLVGASTLPPLIPLEDVLRESCFYPASGLDRSPVLLANGCTHSFVYVDYSISQDEFLRTMRTWLSADGRQALWGINRDTFPQTTQTYRFSPYERILGRDVERHEIVPDGWMPRPPRRFDNPGFDGYQQLMEAQRRCRPFGHWSIWKRLEKSNEGIGPWLFSFLFLGGEALASFQGLYNRNKIIPKILAIIQPGHAFGGNWTNFSDPDAPLWDAVSHGTGLPEYLLLGQYEYQSSISKDCPFDGYTFIKKTCTFEGKMSHAIGIYQRNG